VPFDPAREAKVSRLSREGAEQAAAEDLLRGYGGELYQYLVATLRDVNDADEAFAMFCEDAWRGLPGFRHACSYRTWLYQLARHAGLRLRRGEQRRRNLGEPDGGSAAERIAAEVRTTTAAYLKTDVKDKFRALRDALRPEDRELLVLRLEHDLEWSDIAAVMGEDAATLRKRFERLKTKMRELAAKAGLLG
jgi:RNA polymerase sigma-70 factor (ECF subfamily)